MNINVVNSTSSNPVIPHAQIHLQP